MADSVSLTDEDLRMLGIEVDDSPPKPAAAPQAGGANKVLSQEEIDAMIASMEK